MDSSAGGKKIKVIEYGLFIKLYIILKGKQKYFIKQ